ncbi:unnamed protein product [Adineta ricciae]|nr:unnamed protein product [Adineta ricciae]
MSSLSETLTSLRQAIIRYGFPISLTLGNIGNLFIIYIFCQKQYRHNSCSLYLVAAAISSIIGINWGIGTNMYALYQPPDPFTQSLFLCRLRGFLLQSSTFLYKTMISLGCIDRFAVTSSRVRIREFSKPRVALKVIFGMTLLCMIISIHLPIFEVIDNNRCIIVGTFSDMFLFADREELEKRP